MNEKFKLQCKFDGISGRKNENFLSTRGDGNEGEDISDKLPLINLISNNPNEFDGELLISKSNFKKYFESGKIVRGGGEKYKTSRNAISGLMNNDLDKLDDVLKFGKIIDMVDYNIFSIETNVENIDSDIEKMKNSSYFEYYPTDGFVVKLADEEYGKSLGVTSHHPKHSMALKHDNESAWTRLIGVKFQMAKDTIGMVGIVEPTVINNVTIQRVTLHNMDVIESLDLQIGDEVLIERAGDVIPHIIEAKAGESRDKIYLEKCPSCNQNVNLDKQFYICLNPYCEDKIVNRIDAGLKDLGSKGIAKETIRKFHNHLDINNLVDLMENVNIPYLIFGVKTADNIWEERKRLLNQTYKPEQVFATLNVPGIGLSMFKKIFKVVTWQKMLKMSESELSNIPQMGPERAYMLWSQLMLLKDYIVTLTELFKIKEPTSNNGELNMETVVFTGKGNMGRKEYTEMAEDAGYSVGSSVTKETDILVCADPSSGSSKLKKAEKNGTKIISYDDFEGLC